MRVGRQTSVLSAGKALLGRGYLAISCALPLSPHVEWSLPSPGDTVYEPHTRIEHNAGSHVSLEHAMRMQRHVLYGSAPRIRDAHNRLAQLLILSPATNTIIRTAPFSSSVTVDNSATPRSSPWASTNQVRIMQATQFINPSDSLEHPCYHTIIILTLHGAGAF